MIDVKLKLKPGHTSERSWMDPSPLKTLFWNFTYACNYQCPICFTDSGAESRKELSAMEALSAADKIHEAGVKDVIVSGGEPFLRRDLIDVLERLGQHGISARIATNGSLITDENLAALGSRTLTKSFQVSLDTTDPELYARFHGTSPEIYQTICSNIRRIQDHGFHTTVSVRLTPETLNGIPALLDQAVECDWATVTIHWPIHTNRILNAYPQDADFLSLIRPALEYFTRLPRKWLIETYIPWAEFHPVMRRLEKNIRIVHRGCRAGRDRLTINPGGRLSPCVTLDIPEAEVGHIQRDDLQEVFQQAPFCMFLKHPEPSGLCRECAHLARCGAGCRAAAWALTGSLKGSDGSCPIWKARKAGGERRRDES